MLAIRTLCLSSANQEVLFDNVAAVLQETQRAEKAIVLCLDELNARHQSFAKLGCTLGNLPSSVTDMTPKLPQAGSARVVAVV